MSCGTTSDTPNTLPHVYSVGDQLPGITGFVDEVDLTGYLSVKLQLRRPDGTIVTRTATIVDAADGRFSFDWSATDLVEGRGQLAEIQITNAAGEETTSEKFLIDVVEEIA